MPTTWSSATRSGSARARPAGHYVDLTDFFAKHDVAKLMAPATVEYYAEYPKGSKKYWADPARGRRRRLGLSQGLVRGPQGDGGLQGQVRLRPRPCRRPTRSCATSPSSSIVPTRSSTASRSTPTTPMTRWSWASRGAIFSYGGELGDYATYKVDGILNSQENVERPADVRGPLQVHPAELGQDLLPWRTTRRSPKTWRR